MPQETAASQLRASLCLLDLNFLQLLRDFFQYVLHCDWDKYQVPYPHYDELLPKVPSKKQVEKIIHSLHNPKNKAEIALLYSSGIRVSELTRLYCCYMYFMQLILYLNLSFIHDTDVIPFLKINQNEPVL